MNDPRIDPSLASEIEAIQAIDHHAHPVRPAAPGAAPDKDYDALPVENLEPQPEPVRIRAGSPELQEAERALADLNRNDPNYAVRVLDRLNIGVMLANRVSMGPGLPPDRFLWVPYVDALMYPFPNGAMIHNSDEQAFFALEEKLLARYYADAGVPGRPATLDEYLDKVVRATIERQHRGGAVAEKFEMPYLRPLDIGNPSKAEAEASWASRGKTGYKALQDYIFHFIAAECGRLGMPVHFHSDAGSGSYFDIAGGNPMLLEPVFNDPSLRQTKFVLLHGGWPYTTEITALLAKPGVYLDFSSQTYMHYPGEVAQSIRRWLEFVPEKVMFATDAYPYSAEAGWAETAYVATVSGRQALGIALTGMLRDGEISRPRASELARMVLRDNARALYGLR